MAQRDRKKIRRSLTKKGFVLEQGGNHEILQLYINGMKHPVSTILSRGSGYKTYPKGLLFAMGKQLNLSQSDLLDLIDCPMDGETYIDILKAKGVLTRGNI